MGRRCRDKKCRIFKDIDYFQKDPHFREDEVLTNSRGNWRDDGRFSVVSQVYVPFKYDQTRYRINLREGARFNGADIPHWLRWLVSALDIWFGALIHDILYRNHASLEYFDETYKTWLKIRYNHRDADMIFRFIMKEYDREEYEDRVLAWLAVYTLGKKAFNKGISYLQGISIDNNA